MEKGENSQLKKGLLLHHHIYMFIPVIPVFFGNVFFAAYGLVLVAEAIQLWEHFIDSLSILAERLQKSMSF